MLPWLQHDKILHKTVKQEMLMAIIFGGFENIAILRGFTFSILLEENLWF